MQHRQQVSGGDSLDSSYTGEPASPLVGSSLNQEDADRRRAAQEQRNLSSALQVQMNEVKRLKGELSMERAAVSQLQSKLEEQHRLNYQLSAGASMNSWHEPSTPPHSARHTPDPFSQSGSSTPAGPASQGSPSVLQSLSSSPQPGGSNSKHKVTKKQQEREAEEKNKDARIAYLEKRLEMVEDQLAKYTGDSDRTCDASMQSDPVESYPVSIQTDDVVIGGVNGNTPRHSATPQSDASIDVPAVEVSVKNAISNLSSSRPLLVQVFASPPNSSKSSSKQGGATPGARRHEREISSGSHRSATPPQAPTLSSTGRWCDEGLELELGQGGEVVAPASQGGLTRGGSQSSLQSTPSKSNVSRSLPVTNADREASFSGRASTSGRHSTGKDTNGSKGGSGKGKSGGNGSNNGSFNGRPSGSNNGGGSSSSAPKASTPNRWASGSASIRSDS